MLRPYPVPLIVWWDIKNSKRLSTLVPVLTLPCLRSSRQLHLLTGKDRPPVCPPACKLDHIYMDVALPRTPSSDIPPHLVLSSSPHTLISHLDSVPSLDDVDMNFVHLDDHASLLSLDAP